MPSLFSFGGAFLFALNTGRVKNKARQPEEKGFFRHRANLPKPFAALLRRVENAGEASGRVAVS